jgi:hypothetical protein
MPSVRNRACRIATARIVVTLGALVVVVGCDERGSGAPPAVTTASAAPLAGSNSTSPATTGVPTSTTLDPLAPTTLPFDPSLPRCSDAMPNLFNFPTGDASVAHLAINIIDPGVTGLTDGGNPVLNPTLVAGDKCQLGYGVDQRVTTPGRPPRWEIVSVDGALPDADAGRDIAHLTGRNEATLVFYNCIGRDATVRLADALATIVASSSITCRSSISIHAA